MNVLQSVNYVCSRNVQSLVLSGSLNEIVELLAQVVDEMVDLGDTHAVPQHLLLEVHLVEQCTQLLVGSAHDRVLRQMREQEHVVWPVHEKLRAHTSRESIFSWCWSCEAATAFVIVSLSTKSCTEWSRVRVVSTSTSRLEVSGSLVKGQRYARGAGRRAAPPQARS